MKSLVLYESFLGNIRQIAEFIGNSHAQNKEVRVLNVSDVSMNKITNAKILIVGPATRVFRPCEATKQFLKIVK